MQPSPPPRKVLDEDKEFSFLRRPTEGYVFLVTYGRSGSTLTQNLLNAIPGYCIRGENGNSAYHLCRTIHEMRGEVNFRLRQDQLAGKGVSVPELGQPIDPWYGSELIDLDRYAKRLFNVFTREILNLPPRCRVGGFKEIRYLYDTGFLPHQLELMQEIFPRARILFLTRAHEEVANSSWWRGHDKAALLPQLARADAAFKAYAESHEDCFQLDYAAYARGPEALRPLYDFLGEEMDVAAVREILGRQLSHAKNICAPGMG
jgi:hypothetical protein